MTKHLIAVCMMIFAACGVTDDRDPTEITVVAKVENVIKHTTATPSQIPASAFLSPSVARSTITWTANEEAGVPPADHCYLIHMGQTTPPVFPDVDGVIRGSQEVTFSFNSPLGVGVVFTISINCFIPAAQQNVSKNVTVTSTAG